MVQWLGLHAFSAKGPGSIPGLGNEVLQATQHGQSIKIKKEQRICRCPALDHLEPTNDNILLHQCSLSNCMHLFIVYIYFYTVYL